MHTGCFQEAMSLTFRCYAYRSRQSWEAICVDLDIAVFGGSVNEVQASLGEAVQMHLEGVSELPIGEQGRFLARRSPWHVWARLSLLAWLARSAGNANRARRFTIDSHLPPPPLAEQPPRQAGLAPNSR